MSADFSVKEVQDLIRALFEPQAQKWLDDLRLEAGELTEHQQEAIKKKLCVAFIAGLEQGGRAVAVEQDAPERDELEKNAQLFKEYVHKTKEERAQIINTGMFNSFIEGYLVATLDAMQTDSETITKAKRTLKRVLDTTSAQDVTE